jgi:hypothetical protein
MRRPTSRNKAGLLGVSLIGASGKYRASIYVGGKNFYLGEFSSAGEAHAIYLVAKRQHHTGCTI